jgi:membrane protein implicated in regulation of membrane protease activity
MEIYVYWFLLALVLVGLEIASGTFYLLVIAVALAVGGATAALGASMVWQFVCSAVTGVAGIIMLRRWKSSRTSSTPDIGLDIGLPVKVIKWNDDGTARVFYRGAEWDAELESADTPREGTLYIKAVHGSGLVLTHVKQ